VDATEAIAETRHVVSFRATVAEQAAIREAARRAGMPVGTWLRMRGMGQTLLLVDEATRMPIAEVGRAGSDRAAPRGADK